MSEVPKASQAPDSTEATGAAGTTGATDRQQPAVTPVRVVVALCLVAPFVAMLWVSSYARVEPEFAGMPFFYWYQMLWVVISTGLTMIAYRLWQRDQRARAAAASRKEGGDR